MKFRNFILDDFQVKAIKSIDKGNSVVVSAPTGTGKTLIADYLIDKYIKSEKRIIYTSPIKALSNQKYKEFSKIYGQSNIGIMTGDVVINPNAKVLIMTTEIYRNMLVLKDPFINTISYVVFDEIHYINDIERGTVWEEAIIFSPEKIRFLCLSATIPNAKEFADWIASIKHHNVDVIIHNKRAVPLKHFVFEKQLGRVTLNKLEKAIMHNEIFSGYMKNLSKKQRKRLMKMKPATHIDVINDLINENFLPVIYFSFSRRDCEKKAIELSRMFDFTSSKEKSVILSIFGQKMKPFSDLKTLDSVLLLKKVIAKGIAFHHAGLLPVLKEIVEELFSRNLIKVLYATETFAVGVNMPAKSVVFDSLEKYDGRNFRYLTSKEYWQMAGRAGRRGIDDEGWAIALIDARFVNLDKVRYITSGDKEPLVSRFRLTYNLVLNLIKEYNYKEIEEIMKKSFFYYQKKKEDAAIRIMARFKNMIKKLKAMNYIDENNNLTEKGLFASRIYDHELVISEIFNSEIFEKLDEPEINVVLGTIVYEGKTEREYFKIPKNRGRYNKIINILKKNKFVIKKINKKNLLRLMNIIIKWSEGCEFSEIVNLTSMREGDIIRLFRQIIDFAQQIRNATNNWQVSMKMENCIRRIKRDVVELIF